MNILIDNAKFINKGAELMLYSVMEKMKEFYPKANFVCRAEIPYKIDRLYEYRYQKRQWLIPLSIFPSYVTKKQLGYIAEQKIDIVLDAGGFRFGDQWINRYTPNYISYWTEFYRRMNSRGCKIIFLPQAFGPFEKHISKEFISNVLNYTDLVYAREQTSYNNIINLTNSKKIKLFPDFTNIYKPKLPINELSILEKYFGKVCIIPNSKMLTHTSKEISKNYVNFICKLVNRISEIEEQVFFLNHEGVEDKTLIDVINSKCEKKHDVLTGLNANQIKYIIGQSKTCVSSRYHGLVSSLSQCIPGFCTSWSHKYEELLKDYDFNQGYLSVTNLESINNVETLLQNDYSIEKCIQNLKVRADMEKAKTEKMWLEVISTIEK